MDLLRIFHRTTVSVIIIGPDQRRRSDALCGTCQCTRRLGENDAPRTSTSPFHVRILLLIACLTDSLEALRVSSLHVEIRSDSPCSSRSIKMAKGSGLHAHSLMIKNHSWSRANFGSLLRMDYALTSAYICLLEHNTVVTVRGRRSTYNIIIIQPTSLRLTP
jgi:hypothetical protein